MEKKCAEFLVAVCEPSEYMLDHFTSLGRARKSLLNERKRIPPCNRISRHGVSENHPALDSWCWQWWEAYYQMIKNFFFEQQDYGQLERPAKKQKNQGFVCKPQVGANKQKKNQSQSTTSQRHGKKHCPKKWPRCFYSSWLNTSGFTQGIMCKVQAPAKGKKQKLRKLLVQPGQCNHQHFSAILAWNVFGFGLWGISHQKDVKTEL